MLSHITAFFVRILLGLPSLIICQAIYYGLHLSGRYPERALAEWAMRNIPTPEQTELAYWIIFSIGSFAIWFAIDATLRKFGYISSPARADAKIGQGVPNGVVDTTKGRKNFMSIIELRDEIKKLPGWDLDFGLQYYDLMRAFREAANQELFDVWGRKKPAHGMFLDDVISQKIPSTFWLEGTIDLFLLPNATENDKVVTTINDLDKRAKMPIYFDLQVERDPAIEWAKVDAAKYRRVENANQTNAKKVERDTEVLEALAFLQSGHWGLAPTNLLATKDTDRRPILKCLQDVRQAALDGDIRVWGRSSPSSPLDLIPKGEWKILKIKFLSLFEQNDQTETEIAEIGVTSPLKYHDLMVSRLEVEQKWPA